MIQNYHVALFTNAASLTSTINAFLNVVNNMLQ